MSSISVFSFDLINKCFCSFDTWRLQQLLLWLVNERLFRGVPLGFYLYGVIINTYLLQWYIPFVSVIFL